MNLLAAFALLVAQPTDAEIYHAIGGAPLWQATVSGNFMGFATPGRDDVMVETPARQETELGFAYRTPDLAIVVEHATCRDPLTGAAYADRVTIETGDARYTGCGGRRLAPEMPEPYGAAGSEPFWGLEIADGRLIFGIDSRTVIVPVPRPLVTNQGRNRRYRAPGIDVLLRRHNCELEDERIYADDVTVIVGNRTVFGCGGRVVREAPGE